MIGSEKQIKWAEEIKSGKDFSQYRKSPAAGKAVDFIESIDNAIFWIENRNKNTDAILRGFLSLGLWVNGENNTKVARMDPRTGKITITWTEIVADGKGGHTEKFSETL